MADHAGGQPRWLVNCKENITRTKEWNGFAGDLHEAIQQQLVESHVQSFTNLTDAERTLFIERAARAIQNGHSYEQLYKNVSSSLDQHMNNEVARQLMEDYPINTKSDLILDCAQDGIISLLRKWPGLKQKLNACFNQPLPTTLRQLAWKLFLENSKIRKRYVDILHSKDVKQAISPQDFDISRKCEHLLKSEKTFDDLNGSVGAFYAMKAVLSYHHALKRTKQPLPDVDYMLTVPLVQVNSSALSRREPAPSKVVVLLVEQYYTLMATRHPCMITDGSKESDDALNGFTQKVAEHLQKKSPETVHALSNTFKPSEETIIKTESGILEVVAKGLQLLLRPVIRSLFVGYLCMDAVLYLWDQYMIGLDSPGFHDDFLPVVAAIHLILLTDKFNSCQSLAAVESVLKEESAKLTVPQFQYQMKRHFYNDLYSTLNQEDRAALPVLDPTQVKYPPWTHWYSENIPPHTDAEERRKARDAREVSRQKQQDQYKEEEQQRKEAEERKRRAEQLKFLQEKESEKLKQDQEKLYLEELVEKERKRHIELERDLQFQISQLKQQMDDMRRQDLKSAGPSVWSMETGGSRVAGVIPPPVSPVSIWDAPASLPPTRRGVTPKSKSPALRKPDKILYDFMEKVMIGFNTVVHGNDEEREELNIKTKRDIQNSKSK